MAIRTKVVHVVPDANSNTTDGLPAAIPNTAIASGEVHSAAAARSNVAANPTELSEKAYLRMADIGLLRREVDELIAHIKVQCQELSRERNYTLKQICGGENWSHRSKAQQIAAGQCLPILCDAGVVPLIDIGRKNGSNARLYRVK
jgi:hypothetical protein